MADLPGSDDCGNDDAGNPTITALITGATSGIGLATARRLARSGARIIALGRRADRLQALAAELGENCHTIQFDIADTDRIPGIIANLPDRFSRIDVLVNSAGVALGDAPIQDASWNDLRQTIETNTIGLTAIVHAVLPQMIERRSGDIVNIGSIAGTYPYPKGHTYGASKAFVRQLSLNLRADLAEFGIRVICIEPGTTETEFAAVRMGNDNNRAADFYRDKQVLRAEDVAEVIQFSVQLPRHVNLNVVELMPTAQTSSFFRFVETPVKE